MAKVTTLQNENGDILYPKSVSQEIYNNDTGQTVAAEITALNSEVDAIGPKISNIEAETTSDTSEIIEVQNDAGDETILSISESGVDAKNLKSNGVDVLTEHQDISNLATKSELQEKQDKIDEIEIEGTRQSDDAIVLSNDNEKEYTQIIGERKTQVEDEFLITDDDYDEDNPDESKVHLSVNDQRAKAKTFEAEHFVFSSGKQLSDTGNWFDNAQFIPDVTSPNLGGVVCYNGDTKSSSNYINNAVVYPDGSMIVCRRGGVVAKIALDGTETTLMTISGAGDWRGVFMDKDLNVYVSPHASFGGSGLAMTDRGLYRLAYGSSTFTKVISLYDTGSSVSTETEQNDDTIWTLCQDKKGYLYAGVYAHTVRPNASVYRSTDGGLTWAVTVNFIESLVPTGRHVHVIICNEFNDKLYCIIGEYNEIFCSEDRGITWTAMGVQCEDSKGSAMIAVKDGLIVGSDDAYSCKLTKVYADGSHKTTGRMWSNTVFALRRSDVTGWIYAFTKIDSSVNTLDYMPPIEAIDDADALQDWIDSNPAYLAGWTKQYNYTKDYYPDDCIRPQHCAVLRSMDDGETWQIIHKEFVGSSKAFGYPTTGYFRNGECLCGHTANDNGSLNFTNPLIISEGKHKFTDAGVDVSDDIFAKTLTTEILTI